MVVSSLFCPQVVVIIKIRINLKTCCILATDPDGWPGFDISSTNKMQLDNRKEMTKEQKIEEGGNYRVFYVCIWQKKIEVKKMKI